MNNEQCTTVRALSLRLHARNLGIIVDDGTSVIDCIVRNQPSKEDQERVFAGEEIDTVVVTGTVQETSRGKKRQIMCHSIGMPQCIRTYSS